MVANVTQQKAKGGRPPKAKLVPGKEQEKIKLDIVVDSVYNMFKFKRSGTSGIIPKELSGLYTQKSLASRALEDYLRRLR